MDRDEKIQQLESMTQADPTDPLAFYLLGNEYLHAGRWAGAVAAFERCLALNPDHTAAVRLAADACRKSGDTAGAAAWYRRAIETAERTGDLQVAKEARAFLKKLESQQNQQ